MSTRSISSFTDDEILKLFRQHPDHEFRTSDLCNHLAGRPMDGAGSKLAQLVRMKLLGRRTEGRTYWYSIAHIDADRPEGLRDKFALAVLPAIYADLNGDSRYGWQQMAVRAYQLADAAMNARKSQVDQ